MNSNTFAGFYGGTGVNQIASQTLATATETEFKVNVNSGVTTTIAVLTVPQVGQAVGSTSPLNIAANSSKLVAAPFAGSPYFNTSDLDLAHPFLIRLVGTYLAAGVTSTYLPAIYLGTSKSGTKIAPATAGTPTSGGATTYHFIVEAMLQWDAASGVVDGQFWYNVGGATPAYHTYAVLPALGSAITAAHLQFCATSTWGNAAGGVASVSEFSLTQR